MTEWGRLRRETADKVRMTNNEEVFNLIIYSMASNEPDLPEITCAVSLDLGIMADIGKLYMSACSVISERWNITMYLDMHPNHYIVRMSKNDGKVELTRKTVNPDTKPILARDRVKKHIKKAYKQGHSNGLVLGGHGMVYRRGSEYTPIGFLSDGTFDALPVNNLAEDIEEILGEDKPFVFVALDSCNLATLENVVALSKVTEYVLSF